MGQSASFGGEEIKGGLDLLSSTSKYSHWGLGIQCMNFEGTQMFSLCNI